MVTVVAGVAALVITGIRVSRITAVGIDVPVAAEAANVGCDGIAVTGWGVCSLRTVIPGVLAAA